MPEDNAGTNQIQDSRAIPAGVEPNSDIQPMGQVTPTGPNEAMFDTPDDMKDGPAGDMLAGDPNAFALSEGGEMDMPAGPEGDLIDKDEVDKQVEEFNREADSKAQQESDEGQSTDATSQDAPDSSASSSDAEFTVGEQKWDRKQVDDYLEKSVPLMAQVDELAKQGHDIGHLINQGIKQDALMGQLLDSPDTAISTINGLIHAAIMEHGSDLNPERLNTQSLDHENMTSNEKILYDQNIKLQREMRQMAQNMGKFVTEAQGAVQAQGEIARVKQETGLDISAEELSRMKQTSGVNDPVHAVKISTYGQTRQSPEGAQTKPGQATAEVPSVTNQTSGLFDPDGDYSADDWNRMMSAGMRPAQGKDLEALRARKKKSA